MTIDLRNASYERFIEFVFDHPAVPADELERKWYRGLREVSVNARAVTEHLTRFLEEPDSLLGRFSKEQVIQGIGFLFFFGGRGYFFEQVWNPEVPWTVRVRCIRAIPTLYQRFFEPNGDEDATGFMLWDWIAEDYSCGIRDPVSSAEDARVQDAMFAALVKMLDSDEPATQKAALHGILHLRHRSGQETIGSFLASARSIAEDVREYANRVLGQDR